MESKGPRVFFVAQVALRHPTKKASKHPIPQNWGPCFFNPRLVFFNPTFFFQPLPHFFQPSYPFSNPPDKSPQNFRHLFSNFEGEHLKKITKNHLCHGQGCRDFLGMGDLPPLMTESLEWGPINPYGLGLMSLSPIVWKEWEFRPWHT